MKSSLKTSIVFDLYLETRSEMDVEKLGQLNPLSKCNMTMCRWKGNATIA